MQSTNITTTPQLVGRFAPSPSGRMHIGNIFSFMIAYISLFQQADSDRASMVLRIEDLDPARSKQQWIDQIFRDLEFFGFTWNQVLYQSQRTEAYQQAFDLLKQKSFLYPCYCSRADLHSASAPHVGDEVVYTGTCRPQKSVTAKNGEPRVLCDGEVEGFTSLNSFHVNRQQKNTLDTVGFGDTQRNITKTRLPSWRIMIPDMPDDTITFTDMFQGNKTYSLAQSSGDFIVRRSDRVFAYQLAVVIDDAFQGVTSVVRGWDLLSSVPRQLYLQDCLKLAHPVYGHVPLIVDENGTRLSKRNADATLEYLIDTQKYRPSEILGYLAYCSGIIDEYQPCMLDELVRHAHLDALTNKERIIWRAPQFK